MVMFLTCADVNWLDRWWARWGGSRVEMRHSLVIYIGSRRVAVNLSHHIANKLSVEHEHTHFVLPLCSIHYLLVCMAMFYLFYYICSAGISCCLAFLFILHLFLMTSPCLHVSWSLQCNELVGLNFLPKFSIQCQRSWLQ